MDRKVVKDILRRFRELERGTVKNLIEDYIDEIMKEWHECIKIDLFDDGTTTIRIAKVRSKDYFPEGKAYIVGSECDPEQIINILKEYLDKRKKT